MPLTSAEKQRPYRERHLGVHGAKERIRLFINVRPRHSSDASLATK